MNRRFFLLAAPAIVAAPSLMRVSAACTNWHHMRYVGADMPEWYSGFETLASTPAGVREWTMDFMRESLKLIDSVTALTPEALGIVDGKVPQIDRSGWSWWRNPAIKSA